MSATVLKKISPRDYIMVRCRNGDQIIAHISEIEIEGSYDFLL